jgi:hypothetical protein
MYETAMYVIIGLYSSGMGNDIPKCSLLPRLQIKPAGSPSTLRTKQGNSTGD